MWQNPNLVEDWLRREGQDVEGPLTVSRVGVGQSNITCLVADVRQRQWVLREPPAGATGNAHDVVREAQILRAMTATAIPVPVVLGTGAGPGGQPFMMMERVAGAVLESEGDAAELDASQRSALGRQVARLLGHLHTLDPAILGLVTPQGSYLTRQIRRVGQNWQQVGLDSPHHGQWGAVCRLLQRNVPSVEPTHVIMHGDFRLSNTLVHEGSITAVLDWELCTVGNPLVDLAWLLDDWRGPQEPAFIMPSPTRAGGFPDRSEMIAIYEEITAFDLDEIDYYRGFSQWRAASLLQGVLTRRRNGAMGSHGGIDLTELDESIGTLISSAAAHLGG
jgi:aminoglycoside phosphotransferase (APT) family kinase protein